MGLFLSILTYIIMAVLIGAGIMMAIKGSFWLLAAAVIGYFVLLIRYGCQTH